MVQPVSQDVTGIGPGTLKCLIVAGGMDALLAALPERVGAENIRQAGGVAVLVHTYLTASDLRDWLSGTLGEGESLLVLEFETWSCFGGDVDSEWLLARGH